MNTVKYISQELADDKISSQQIKSGLLVLGYKAQTYHLQKVLLTSSLLSENFIKFGQYFPRVQTILSDFLRSQIILDKLNSSQDIDAGHSDKLRVRCVSPFCESIISDEFNLANLSRNSLNAELLAFLWLVHTVVNASPGIVKTPRLTELLKFSLIYVQFFYVLMREEHSQLNCVCPDIRDGNDDDWLNQLSFAVYKMANGHGFNVLNLEDIQLGFKDALSIMRAFPVLSSNLQDEEHEDVNLSTKLNQRGLELSERERLINHHNAFQQQELEKLASAIRQIVENEHTRSNYYLEASLVGLAITTGRSIEDAVRFPLARANEYISIELFPGLNNKFNYPIWNRILNSGETLRLALPEFLRKPINHISCSGAETLEDCLPYTIMPWADRCYEWLLDKIGGSRNQVCIKIRDALTRAIYQSSSSPALLNQIATSTHAWGRLESLSNYVNLRDSRTSSTYANACKKLFGKYGAQNIPLRRDNRFGIDEHEHSDISRFFMESIEHSIKTSNFINYHNALSRYCLMLLVVATGHRKSDTPFYFRWDVLCDEELAFVCDKLIVGSEARFVPLPSWVARQIAAYRRHLIVLSAHLKSKAPLLAKTIFHLANGGDVRALTDKKHSDGKPNNIQCESFGMFFTLSDTLSPSTISTAGLSRYYQSVSDAGIPVFRKVVANSLWSNGLSGQQVEAFLGHNGKMHAFGESSAWSVVGWSTQIRPIIEKYLADFGWKEATVWEPKSASRFCVDMKNQTPFLYSSSDSYEGRARSRMHSLALVRQLVRSNFPLDWFGDGKTSISESDINFLHDIVRAKLQFDRKAIQKINQIIAFEIKRLRNRIRNVSSAKINLTRTEAGPIEITASRHLAVAKSVRTWWIEHLGSFNKTLPGDCLHRLAQIGISLVIFDAVLDPDLLKSLLEAIANHEARSVEGCIIVRARIEKSSIVFDKSLILSVHTTALVIGLERLYPDYKTTATFLKDVNRLINNKLKSAPKPSSLESYTLIELCATFSAWWQIRLPGAQFAVATGKYSGSAADIASECAIFGDAFVKAIPVQSRNYVQNPLVTNVNSSPKIAIKAFNNMLKMAEGSLEKKQATTRFQRKKLMVLVSESIPSELQILADNQPIVSLMLDFIVYMIEEGGIRKEFLRFSSIRTYFSNIRLLLEIVWDKNPLDFESADFDECYQALLNKTKDKASTVEVGLSLFHQFLRETIDAPHCRIAANSKRIPIQCRSSVVTIAQFEKAWPCLPQIVDANNMLMQYAKSYLSLGYAYGLRRKEIYGLGSHHVLPDSGVYIKRNNIRDLKSTSSHRFVPSLLLDKKQQKYLSEIVGQSMASPLEKEPVFADAEFKNQLYPTSKIDTVIRDALRAATGNSAVVPYSLRHSAATRLTHFAFLSPRAIPVTQHVKKSLTGSYNQSSFFSSFDGGFHAWPFWIDRVAMILGHANVDTLLNTYWHSSNCCLAEHTWHASENDRLTDGQIANMLGRDRTSIIQMRSRLSNRIEEGHANAYEFLVTHYVKRSGIPKLSSDEKTQSNSRARAEKHVIGNQDENSVNWNVFDRLLCHRLRNGLSLAQLENFAPSIGIGQKAAREFIRVYKETVEETGFDDFEPENSEILLSKATRASGVLRGESERERGLAAAQKLSYSSEIFAGQLRSVLSLWVQRVNYEEPYFVARDASELSDVLQVLKSVGVALEQFEFFCCNFDVSSLKGIFSKSQLPTVNQKVSRMSRGAIRIRQSEVGVRVMQSIDAKIGDGRDTHRLAFVLAIISQVRTG
jgi:integrase